MDLYLQSGFQVCSSACTTTAATQADSQRHNDPACCLTAAEFLGITVDGAPIESGAEGAATMVVNGNTWPRFVSDLTVLIVEVTGSKRLLARAAAEHMP